MACATSKMHDKRRRRRHECHTTTLTAIMARKSTAASAAAEAQWVSQRAVMTDWERALCISQPVVISRSNTAKLTSNANSKPLTLLTAVAVTILPADKSFRWQIIVPLWETDLQSRNAQFLYWMFIIILYYAVWGSTRVKNTKYKYTIKTYKNRELQNRQQENTTAICLRCVKADTLLLLWTRSFQFFLYSIK